MTKTIAIIILLTTINTLCLIVFAKMAEQVMDENNICVIPHIRQQAEFYECK